MSEKNNNNIYPGKKGNTGEDKPVEKKQTENNKYFIHSIWFNIFFIA